MAPTAPRPERRANGSGKPADAKKMNGEAGASDAEGGDAGADDDDDEEEASVSLAAMESALKPPIIETFDADRHDLHQAAAAPQDKLVATQQRGEDVCQVDRADLREAPQGPDRPDGERAFQQGAGSSSWSISSTR